MTLVLGAVYRTISGYLLKMAGQSRSTADTGAVTLIQRFGSALNLNVHFHMIFLDGVYLRMHLTRYHGVGAKKLADQAGEAAQPSPAKHVAMSWAKRLKRVFGVEIEDCTGCGGKLKIIASIEEPAVIARILAHLEKASSEDARPELAPVAARPAAAGHKAHSA